MQKISDMFLNPDKITDVIDQEIMKSIEFKSEYVELDSKSRKKIFSIP